MSKAGIFRRAFMVSLAVSLLIVTAASFSGCAFTGSEPPPVPHGTAGGFGDCRGCHEQGVEGAPRTDHALKPDCLSCHPAVPQP
jgi:hypothetical protein